MVFELSSAVLQWAAGATQKGRHSDNMHPFLLNYGRLKALRLKTRGGQNGWVDR